MIFNVVLLVLISFFFCVWSNNNKLLIYILVLLCFNFWYGWIEEVKFGKENFFFIFV